MVVDIETVMVMFVNSNCVCDFCDQMVRASIYKPHKAGGSGRGFRLQKLRLEP